MNRLRLFAVAIALFSLTHSPAAEVTILTKANYDSFPLQGKEIDAIYGDIVIRNDKIIAVIAQPKPGRNANMTVRGVGGALIDLTQVNRPNDQLSCLYPAAGTVKFESWDGATIKVDGKSSTFTSSAEPQKGTAVSVSLKSIVKNNLQLTTTYTLRNGDNGIAIETRYQNVGKKTIKTTLKDTIRADRTFKFGNTKGDLFWADDEWFRQAYAVHAGGRSIKRGSGRALPIEYQSGDSAEATIEPGRSVVLVRSVTPGSSLLEAVGLADQATKRKVSFVITDPQGPVANARISLLDGKKTRGTARTDSKGRVSFRLPAKEYAIQVEAVGRKTFKTDLAASTTAEKIQIGPCGYVEAKITDADGKPIPCKVAFIGIEGTKNPEYGPDSAAGAVRNLVYTHTGAFKQEIGPGRYEVIISRGNEYDAIFKKITITAEKTTAVSGKLMRVVKTPGWISAEYHSHSSPSGDNTGSQFGRVLNLLAEHLEFAPCTEHNRVDSYSPHLVRLQCEHLMATCPGMELTGNPLPVNHQNAFPLIHRRRTQDGGGPRTDSNPVVQIERLKRWDSNSEKLVQGNHPNLYQIYDDRDIDGKTDGGFRKMFDFMDVMEVHPLNTIFNVPEGPPAKGKRGNTIYRWMELINRGYRITGVVNTDAHYNYHGSGWLRNYVKSSTDDPAKIDTMEMVRASQKGHLIMTNGPYMEVTAQSRGKKVTAGEELQSENGTISVRVRVQCANWLDINRVQVFVNGKADPRYNFLRRTHPKMFSNNVVKFDQQIKLELPPKCHVIVAAAGEGLQLGRVMGPNFGKRMPMSVSNPIFISSEASAK